MSNTSAYILIESIPGKSMDLVQQAKTIDGIKKIDVVTGPYDVIAYAEADDLKALGDVIVKKIQATGFVSRTLTCITVEQ